MIIIILITMIIVIVFSMIIITMIRIILITMIIIIGYSSLLPRKWVRNAKLLPAGKLRGITAHIFLIIIITVTALSYSPDYWHNFEGIATLLVEDNDDDGKHADLPIAPRLPLVIAFCTQ